MNNYLDFFNFDEYSKIPKYKLNFSGSKMKIKVIIPASGTGSRFGGSLPKQFLKIGGREILALSAGAFHQIKRIDEIVIAARKEYFERIKLIIRKNNFYKIRKIIEGGKLRQDSVYRGLMCLECEDDDIILVHDSVRPFISQEKITELINEAAENDCVIPGLPVSETLKRVNGKNFVTETIDRNNIMAIQTPQAFRYGMLRKAFEKAMADKITVTDESGIAEYSGIKVKVIEGERRNIKITTKSDIY